MPTPNLEIMKLGQYYRTELNQITNVLTSFDETDAYEKILLRADNSIHSIPRDILWKENVEFGGLAFTEGSYKPLQPELVEFMNPNPRIYQSYLTKRLNDGIKPEEVTAFLENSYYRMYAGGKQLSLPRILKRKRVYIYDKNIFVPSWQDILNELIERGPSKIYTIYPILCKSVEDFLLIRKMLKLARTNQIVLDFFIKPQDLQSFFKEYKNKLLAEIGPASKIYLYLGKNQQVNHYDRFFFDKNIIYTLNILYSFWSRKIPIKLLLYKHHNVAVINPYDKLYNDLVLWVNHGADKNFIDRKLSKETQKQLNSFIDNNPNCRDLFEQNMVELNRKGFWSYN